MSTMIVCCFFSTKSTFFLFGSIVFPLSHMSSIPCLCLSLLLPLVLVARLSRLPLPIPRAPSLPASSFHQPTSGPACPALKKGCCHWEIAHKCPGGLHQLLSYRDVKCFKLLTQMADLDSRTTQLQWCRETLKGSCYLSYSINIQHLFTL